MPDLIHPYFEAQAALFPREGVWQHVPPQSYKDRMANEGAPATPPGGYPLTDHGGSTIQNPKLVIVYFGPWWGDKAKIEQFAKELMEFGYLSPLSAYGSGVGTFLGAWYGPTVSGTVTDAQLQAALTAWLGSPGVPQPDGHTLYALLLPEGVTVEQGGSTSCSAFCAYHDAMPDGKTFYAVMTATSCPGCNEGDPFAGFTAVLSHEVAEACTDAVPGKGWYNDATGMENADEWAWAFKPYGPWTVQGYQVNGVGDDFGAYTVPSSPQPQPQPSCRAQADPIITDCIAALTAAANGADAWTASYYRYAATVVTWVQQQVDVGVSS